MEKLLEKVNNWVKNLEGVDDVTLEVYTDGGITVRNYYSEEVIFEAESEQHLLEYMGQ